MGGTETNGQARVKLPRLYDRVKVSADLTGTGKEKYGYIDNIYEFFNETFYSVRYDYPDENGSLGVQTTNPGMLEPTKTEE